MLLALTAGGQVFAANPDSAPLLAPTPEPARPQYQPGEGWKTLKPYRDGDYIDSESGGVWMKSRDGAKQPATGGHLPETPD
ncbi:MAG: hypothetical protein PVF40_07280 [Ectothiorhodospiraceae bacterium]|jgi:hypothetical protein